MWRPFACRPALFITFFLVDARGCRFLGSKPVDCHFISFGTSVRTTATSSACLLVWALLLQTAFCLRRFRPMAISSSACSPCLGPYAPNGFLLVSIPHHGDIFLPLARNVLAPFWSRTASLAFNPPHGDIPFSSPSWRCSIFLRLTATSNFLPPPWHLIGAFRHHANAKQRTGAMMRPRRFRHLPPSRFFPHHGVALLLAFLPGSWISAPSAFTPGHSYSFITPILLARGHSLPSR